MEQYFRGCGGVAWPPTQLYFLTLEPSLMQSLQISIMWTSKECGVQGQSPGGGLVAKPLEAADI